MTVTPHRLFEQSWPDGEYRFFQLGFVVDDLIAAAMNWTKVFGVGPFHIMPRGAMAYTTAARHPPLTFRSVSPRPARCRSN